MGTPSISIAQAINIVKLKVERNPTGKIKNIMLNRYDLKVTTRGIQKIIKRFNETSKYEDQKQSGKPYKRSARSKRNIKTNLFK